MLPYTHIPHMDSKRWVLLCVDVPGNWEGPCISTQLNDFFPLSMAVKEAQQWCYMHYKMSSWRAGGKHKHRWSVSLHVCTSYTENCLFIVNNLYNFTENKSQVAAMPFYDPCVLINSMLLFGEQKIKALRVNIGNLFRCCRQFLTVRYLWRLSLC